MDTLFLRQVWAGNETMLLNLLQDTSELGRARLHYFIVNKGPWSRLDHNEPFIPGAPAKPEQRLIEFLVQQSRLLGRRRGNEARAALPARVAVQSELRDHEGCALHVQQRPVHFPLFILEDTQVCDLFRQRSSHRGRIFPAHAKQNHQPGADFPGDAFFDRNLGTAHPLHNSSHRRKYWCSACREQALVLNRARLPARIY